MSDHSQVLEGLIRQFWSRDGQASDIGDEILKLAVACFPASVAVAANCLPIMNSRLEDLPGWKGRVEAFESRLASRVSLRRRVDQLADPDTPVEALFELLEVELEDLQLPTFDKAILQNARYAARSRAEAAKALFDSIGQDHLPDDLRSELDLVLADLFECQQRFSAHALFTSGNHGFVLGLKVIPDESGETRFYENLDQEMRRQAQIALDLAQCNAAKISLQWPTAYTGKSIGLSLYLGALVGMGRMKSDPLMAATGELDIEGRVLRIEGIAEKLEAARRSGIRQVVLPEANRTDVERLEVGPDLQLTFVDRYAQLPTALYRQSRAAELSFGGRVQTVRSLALTYGLDVVHVKEVQNGVVISLADARGTAQVNVYTGPKGSVTVTGPDGSAKAAACRLVERHLTVPTEPARPAATYKVLDAIRRSDLLDALLHAGAAPHDVRSPHEAWRVELVRPGGPVSVTLYQTGSLVVGGGPAVAHEEVERVLRRVLGGLGGLETTAIESERPDPNAPHIGTDEAGKGDFFGPLVSAAVFVDASLVGRLVELGVRDSKRLSDKRVRYLAEHIRDTAARRYAVTLIGPRRFNSLYAEMRREGKNLNTLLAWGHARSIEDLLRKRVQAEYILVDKFADTKYMQDKILADTRQSGLALKQFTKAESDVAVAAASILARDSFLGWIADTSQRLGIAIPKGASDTVVEVAKRIVREHGEARLATLAKMSFRTTKKVFAP